MLYDMARERMISNRFDWATMAVSVVAWRGPYSFLETNESVADITAGGGQLVMVGLPLLNQFAMPGGYARSDTAIIPTIPANPDEVTFLTLVEMAGAVDAYPLIAFIDDAVGLPFVPNGQDQAVDRQGERPRVRSLGRGVAQPGSALALGARSRRFESGRPDLTRLRSAARDRLE